MFLYFYKVQGGGATLLANQPLPAALVPGTTHWLEVRTLGSTLEGWWDGARLLQVTDGFQQTATRHGLDWNSAFDATSIYSNFYLRGNGTPAIPPSITIQPQGQTIASGHSATMSVAAAGAAPLTYQWYLGLSGATTTPIAGAMASSFTTASLTTAASYWVRVVNAFGTGGFFDCRHLDRRWPRDYNEPTEPDDSLGSDRRADGHGDGDGTADVSVGTWVRAAPRRRRSRGRPQAAIRHRR